MSLDSLWSKRILNYVWDTGTLTWVPETQAGGGSGGTVDQGTGGLSAWLVTGPLTDTQLRASAVPVSAASLPLPTGASTAAKQDTGNTSVASIDTKTPALGQALAAASVPIVLTAAQVTTLTPPAAITGFALEAGHLATIDTSTAASKTDLDTLAGTVTSARAAVNPISGQAGVQGASGLVTALTQRVVLATDVALPTGSNVIGHVIADFGSTTAVTGNVTAIQGTATSLKTQAESYQGGTAVGTGNPLQVSLANTGANSSKLLVTPDSVALPANQSVNISQINATTPLMGAGNTGTGSPRVTIATDQAVLPVGGNIAHDGVDSGNPVKEGRRALSYGSNPTGVSSGDRTDLFANVAGIPFALSGHPNIITRRDNYTAAQTDTAIVSVAGGAKIVVVSVTVAADAANSVKPAVRLGFGATNTPTGAGTYLSHPGVPAGGGIREAGAVAGADGEDWRITCAVPTGGSLDIVTKYFTIES